MFSLGTLDFTNTTSTGSAGPGVDIKKVDNYQNLPTDLSNQIGKLFYVSTATGKWSDGTIKSKGFYTTTGSSWNYLGIEIPVVTDAEIENSIKNDEIRRFNVESITKISKKSVAGDYQFDNKHFIPIVSEIIEDVTAPQTSGVYLFMDKRNSLIANYVTNGIFNNNSSGVTVEYTPAIMNNGQVSIKLVRYEYPANEIVLKGKGLYHLDNINNWVQTGLNWRDYMDSSDFVDGSETAVTSPKAGTRYEYTYKGNSIYRFVPDAYSKSDDAFYEDSALSIIITRRA